MQIHHLKIKKPLKIKGFFVNRAKLSNFSYVSSLKPLWTFDHIEFNIIPFLQRFESITGDCRKMTKDIFTIFLFKKAKTLCVVEPFYFSFCHFLSVLLMNLILPGSDPGFLIP